MFKTFIALQYRMGRITAAQVRALAQAGRITQADADEIVGGGEA